MPRFVAAGSRSYRYCCPAVLTVTLFGILLAGCGRKPPEKTTIDFWHIQVYHPTIDVVGSAVKRFEKENPDVAVKVVPIKGDPFKQKIKVSFGAGNPPDVFHTWGGGALEALVRAGGVLDITDELDRHGWRDRLNPKALSFATFSGRTYAVPADITVVPMWYNTDMFKKHGIDVPRTFEDFKAACTKLKNAGVIPIALGNAQKWPGAFYFIYLATRAGGTETFEKAAARLPGGSFADESFVTAGERIRELVDIGAFPVGFNGMKYDESRPLFFNEKAAMTLMGTWILAHCKSENPEFLSKMGCFPFPVLSGGSGRPSSVVGGINAAYAVSSGCGSPAEAVGLLRHLTSVETAREWAQTGRIPAVDPGLLGGLVDDATKKAAEILFAADRIQLYYDQYLPPRLAECHKETTQAIFAGTMTPKQAAAEMESLARKIDKQTRTGTGG